MNVIDTILLLIAGLAFALGLGYWWLWSQIRITWDMDDAAEQAAHYRMDSITAEMKSQNDHLTAQLEWAHAKMDIIAADRDLQYKAVTAELERALTRIAELEHNAANAKLQHDALEVDNRSRMEIIESDILMQQEVIESAVKFKMTVIWQDLKARIDELEDSLSTLEDMPSEPEPANFSHIHPDHIPAFLKKQAD